MSKSNKSRTMLSNEELLTKEINQKYGVNGLDLNLMKEALTHSSYVKEANDRGIILNSYERLELLGDKVLGMVVCEELYGSYKEMFVGEMTVKISDYVDNKNLRNVANTLELEKYLYLGNNVDARDTKVMADVIEAIVGTIYLSTSLETTKMFIANSILKKNFSLKESDESKELIQPINRIKRVNYKNAVQEIFQKQHMEVPKYKLLNETGPDHKKEFEMALTIFEKIRAVGVGKTKKEAENEAAKVVYLSLIAS